MADQADQQQVPGAIAGVPIAVGATPLLAGEIGPALAAVGARVLTGVALKQAIDAIIGGLLALNDQRFDDSEAFVVGELGRVYPERTPVEIRRLIEQEAAFEREFRRKMRARLARDLPGALRTPGTKERIDAIRQILDREKRYIVAREEAMFGRAVGKAHALRVKEDSPLGAYWQMSPYVRTHCLRCLAMAEQFWPWEVLDAIAPPLHPNCGCHLIGLDDAVAAGLMDRDQIPGTADAIARARRGQADAKDAEASLGEQEIHDWIDSLVLEEAPGVHPLRYAKGTVKGGEFRPRRGGSAAPVLDKLFDRPTSPVALRGEQRARHAWVNGRYTRVPHADTWTRRSGGSTYTSPAGGTNVYRDGKLLDGLGKTSTERYRRQAPAPPRAIADAVKAARADLRGDALEAMPELPAAPLTPGDGASGVLAMRDAGYDLTGASGGTLTFRSPGTGAVADVGFDGRHVTRVNWDPVPVPPPPGKALTRPPFDWEEFRQDGFAWANELAQRYDAPLTLTDIQRDSSLGDHAGAAGWDGVIHLGLQPGRDVFDAGRARLAGDPLGDGEKQNVWRSTRALAHEIAHSVRKIDPVTFRNNADKNLEEALAADMGDRLARERLLAQGQGDVVAWHDAHPDDWPVYARERGALASLLGPDDPGQQIEDLAMRTPPGERMTVLADGLVAHGRAPDFESALAKVEATMDVRPEHPLVPVPASPAPAKAHSYYHVAPWAAKDAIGKQGLLPRGDGRNPTYPNLSVVAGDVYAYPTGTEARQFAKARSRQDAIYKIDGIPDDRLAPDHEDLQGIIHEADAAGAYGDNQTYRALQRIKIDGSSLPDWWRNRITEKTLKGKVDSWQAAALTVPELPVDARVKAAKVLRTHGYRLAIVGPVAPENIQRLPGPPQSPGDTRLTDEQIADRLVDSTYRDWMKNTAPGWWAGPEHAEKIGREEADKGKPWAMRWLAANRIHDPAVDAAIEDAEAGNAQNPSYADWKARVGDPPVVAMKARHDEDSGLMFVSEGYHGTGVIVVYPDVVAGSPFGAWTPGSTPEPGKAGGALSLPSAIRHEFGHYVWAHLDTSQREQMRGLIPEDRDVLSRDLSAYAARNADPYARMSSANEAFAEVFATVTDPRYDRSKFPAWVGQVQDKLDEFIPAAPPASPSDEPSALFHVAPASAREDIRKNGLRPSGTTMMGADDTDPRVYMHQTAHGAMEHRAWGKMGGRGADVWRVDPKGLDIEMPPADPFAPGTAYPVTKQAVPPGNLTLVVPNDMDAGWEFDRNTLYTLPDQDPGSVPGALPTTWWHGTSKVGADTIAKAGITGDRIFMAVDNPHDAIGSGTGDDEADGDSTEYGVRVTAKPKNPLVIDMPPLAMGAPLPAGNADQWVLRQARDQLGLDAKGSAILPAIKARGYDAIVPTFHKPDGTFSERWLMTWDPAVVSDAKRVDLDAERALASPSDEDYVHGSSVKDYQHGSTAKVTPTGNPGPHDRFDKYVPPLDKDVLAITDHQTAEAFFAKLGVSAGLDFSKGVARDVPEQTQVKFLREAAQATKDAMARSPTLKDGKWAKLGTVTLASNLPPNVLREYRDRGEWDNRGPLQNGVWAQTGSNPATTWMSWGPRDGETREYAQDARKDGVWVVINDVAVKPSDVHFLVGHYDSNARGGAAADSSIYGRLTHELGHAADQAEFRFKVPIEHYSEPEVDALDAMDGYTMSKISRYGGASPFEAIAEIYATLHTPHGMDGLGAEEIDAMRKVQEAANRAGRAWL